MIFLQWLVSGTVSELHLGEGGTKEEFAPPWNLYIGMQAHQLRLLHSEDFSVLNFCSHP